MIFRGTGEIRDGFYVIGSAHYPMYMLNGEKSILFEGGLTAVSSIYIEDIEKILGKGSPEMLFLTHVHFDHCGSVHYIKKAFPGLEVAASKKAAEIIIRPNAITMMKGLSRATGAEVIDVDGKKLLQEPFKAFEIDMTLEEGDIINLENGISIQVLFTPGHTKDFLSYYVPEKRILIASDAVGVADTNNLIFTECLVGFNTYMKSLERMSLMDVDILCQGHHLVYVDEDVPAFFERSKAAAFEFKDMVEEFCRKESGDIKHVIPGIRAIEYDNLPEPKQSEEAYLINLEARIKSVMDDKGEDDQRWN